MALDKSIEVMIVPEVVLPTPTGRLVPRQAAGEGAKGGSAATRVVKLTTAGLLLTEFSLKPIYANGEAARILSYPEDPGRIEALDGFLTEKVRGFLPADSEGVKPGTAVEFQSGRRRYLCRAFSLDSAVAGSGHTPAIAFLIERTGRPLFDVSRAGERYGLTRRERETLELLVEGLTNKEIGQRMKISPNTVKAFLKLMMIKMGTATRSGIIGRTLNASS